MSWIELLLLPEVEKRTRLSRTTIWRMERKGLFPLRLKIGVKRVAWDASEIDKFVKDRRAARAATRDLTQCSGKPKNGRLP